ncbi:OsmC family protein [Roseivirga sp.]|uniref:OsmC family protein n=1 Tax=Roseivirga sp. TaxID=1964215 RepID=UPI003B8BB519
MKDHHYQIALEWTGNLGTGTKDYLSYSRDHSIKMDHKPNDILGSSDPSFRGDKSRYNPEELFLSSISACHMLWYLHLCAVNHINVLSYQDNASGTMEENKSGSGKFKEVTLYPKVLIETPSHIEKAISLHSEAHKMCFIANSCNFPIGHQPKITSK